MDEALIIFCPDCRGKFTIEQSDIIEDDIIECHLCGAELIVTNEDPIMLKPMSMDEYFWCKTKFDKTTYFIYAPPDEYFLFGYTTSTSPVLTG